MAKLRLIIILGSVLVIVPVFLLLLIGLQKPETHTTAVTQKFLPFCGTPKPSATTLLGKEIFMINCAACHRVYGTDNMLRGYKERMPNTGYLRLFITCQDSLLKAKDPYALSVKTTWDTLYIHRFRITKNEAATLESYLEFTQN